VDTARCCRVEVGSSRATCAQQRGMATRASSGELYCAPRSVHGSPVAAALDWLDSWQHGHMTPGV
jgi:hypothetical protein